MDRLLKFWMWLTAVVMTATAAFAVTVGDPKIAAICAGLAVAHALTFIASL